MLITGAGGRLARTAGPALRDRGWEVVALTREEVDVADAEAVSLAVASHRPSLILNLAAWTSVDGCEGDPERAERINSTAVRHLSRAAEAIDAHLVHISSDYVFDGVGSALRREDDPIRPVNAYGRSKASSEREVGEFGTVLRVAWVSGCYGRSLVRSALEQAADPAAPMRFVDDRWGSPTVADDLVAAIDHVARHRLFGRYHVANEGRATPWDVARLVVAASGQDPDRVVGVPSAEFHRRDPARRPQFTALDCSAFEAAGGPELGGWEEAHSRLVSKMQGQVLR